MRNIEEIDKINRDILKVTERIEDFTADLWNLVIEGQHKNPKKLTVEYNSTIMNNSKKSDIVKINEQVQRKESNCGRSYSQWKILHIIQGQGKQRT